MFDGHFPDLWKRSFITPIYKSNNRENIRNYRPISKLNIIPKLFEAIITEKLTSQLKNVIINEQHGFRNNRSTTTNLLTFQQFTLEKLEANTQVDVVYADFSKAFDSVNHNFILQKLYHIGVHGAFLKWIEGYLKNRIQNVKYKAFTSRDIRVTSGVPQGSHLGPLLFLLFINDVKSSLLPVNFLLFADDLKLYFSIKSIDDCETLQRNLNGLSTWCNSNKLPLNIDKCKVLRYHRSRKPITYDYSLDGHVLESVTKFKDLGVIFDPKLKFVDHVQYISSKANRVLGFVRRMTSDFSNIQTLKTYFTLVRPSLLYASPIWSPFYQVHIKKLETIQHKFLNYVAWKIGLPSPWLSHDYKQVAAIINISSLSSHRNLNDLTFFFDLLNSVIDCEALLAKINISVPSRDLSCTNQLSFTPSSAKTNLYFFSPLNRMTRIANNTSIEMTLSRNQFIRQARERLLKDFN